ncbi:TfoX/Sxy family protein [Mycobacterium yunnanensis]|uniref:TfoX/Sxy family protein n=1 Tax=Mycobacterium yunnanensis TaxID=368477 RepID=A0A9X2YXR9_9MYCO|nr:TfoX/Sxy family protein [Mycobacterium yunnanensis]MCV7420134.1 TfoX/Sxy family protein [Mycobacterium yunnanensis]
MAYDEDLANRVRELVGGAEERRMFGGLAFMVGGNMAVCVSGQGGLMVRVPAEDTDALLARKHVEPMVMAGRETRGWIRVGTEGLTTTRQLRSWVERGTHYAAGLPAK